MAQKASKKEQVVKQPKTIKVTTLLKAFAILAVILGAFFGGYAARQHEDSIIRQEAVQMVSQLKVNQ